MIAEQPFKTQSGRRKLKNDHAGREVTMILDEIVENRRKEIERRKQDVPETALLAMMEKRSPVADFHAAISRDKGRVKLICEIKKASPSAGVIKEAFEPVEIARAYESGSADALSVLTEEKYFLGRLEFISAIKTAGVTLPILRKDFTLDTYQITEAAAYGADAVLLIVGVISPAQIANALGLCDKYGLAAVVEVYTKDQLKQALDWGAEIIQINNRDLRSFRVDLHNTEKLFPLIPKDTVVISASGIRAPEDVQRLRELGVDAVLVGETLVRHPDPASLVRELAGAAG